MNLGLSEMLFLFGLALIVFGPKRLPEIGRQIGKALAEFKRASNEFKAQIEEEVRTLEQHRAEREQPSILPPAGTVSSQPWRPAAVRDASFDSAEEPDHAAAAAPELPVENAGWYVDGREEANGHHA